MDEKKKMENSDTHDGSSKEDIVSVSSAEPPVDDDGEAAPTTTLVSDAVVAAAAAATTTTTHVGGTNEGEDAKEKDAPFQFTSTLEDLLSTALTSTQLDSKKTNTSNNKTNMINNKEDLVLSSFSSQPNSNINSNNTSNNSNSSACPLFCLLPADIANRDIFLRHLKPSQRKPLFTIPEFCHVFHIKDCFCSKHGVVYLTHQQVRHGITGDDNNVEDSPYDMLLPSDEDPDPDVGGDDEGDASDDESGEGDDDRDRMFGKEVMSKVLKDIKNDGKDVNVFLSKLTKRTVEFPIEHWEDNIVNVPEVPLGEDQEYGQYFRRLKKCQSCEVEARTRHNAKRGILLCYLCEEASPLYQHVFCDECNHNHGCEDCEHEDVYFCERCDGTFCYTDCSGHSWCVRCDKNACKNCEQDGEFLFCNVCNEEVCEDCDIYPCEDCNDAFCYECRGGGYRACCGKFRCGTCADYSFCEGCAERFCDECVDVSGYCFNCGEFFCDTCGGMQMCAKCRDVECYRCVDIGASCDDCGKTFCDHCCCNPRFSELAHCFHCKESFCMESCRDKMTCDDCESRACTNCTVTCDDCCYTSCLKCLGKPKEECTNCTFCRVLFKQSTDTSKEERKKAASK